MAVCVVVDDDNRAATMTMTASAQLPLATGPRLLVFTDAGRTAHALPPDGDVVLGRGQEAHVRVDDESLSRKHAVLHMGRVVEIEDAGSRNGTHVNGRRLAAGERAPVTPGEAFGLGKTVCVVELPKAKKPNAKAPGKKQKLESLVALVAGSEISAVLHGETGVGKEVTARAIHEASARKRGPFVGINCAALPENLLESELFGYERGERACAPSTSAELAPTLRKSEAARAALGAARSAAPSALRKRERRPGGRRSHQSTAPAGYSDFKNATRSAAS